MSEFLDRISKLSPQRLALLADQLNDRLQAAEQRRRVPLAIVGIGCRLPGGVHDPESFWKLLSEGVDAVNEVPASRWDVEEFYDRDPDTPGKMSTRWGGFIDDPDQFDPKFFGIAPAEASSMDPQQRLLLETAWEALEHAGIAPSKLAGTRSGVFLGICNGDYSHVAMSSPRETISPYFASGLSHAVAAGRISYVLGLQGPSLAVDTSCSASLVAIHLACQSLRLGESDTALAGGVNIVLNQDITIALSQSKMMAPDGRCKAFSDSANGFVRGEGSGMIVLKRLPDAVRDGNRILAVIRGSACNQDGRSSGLTAPNGPSQEAVISAALADAGLTPDHIQYIEAHGTGTSLGDPIEAGALNAVFAGRKRSEPLRIGSVKSNLGHLESAAGIAGLIKLVLSLQHRKIPASLHLGTPNNRIDWEQLPLKIPTKIETWDSGDRKRAGGVSSFGFSGTNAHVIVEEYPEAIASSSPENRPRLFELSAKTESALGRMAGRLRSYLLAHPQAALADVARTLNAGRSHFEFRAAMTADSQGELLRLLEWLERGGVQPQIETGRAVGRLPRVAFVFDGSVPIDAAVGREFFDAAPAFREAFEQCDAIAKNDLGLPLASFDTAKNGNDRQDASYRNAWEFAVQYALAQLWHSCGIEPAVVLGSGVGEYVAATVAGVFGLQDGLRLAILRGKGNAAELEEFVRRISYREPEISFIGNSGSASVISAEYWMRGSDGNGLAPAAVAELAKEKTAAKLYVGGRQGLIAGDLTLLKPKDGFNRARGEGRGGCREFLNAAAALYVLGCEPEMSGFCGEAANLVALPTYPFERERYWIDAGDRRNANSQRPASQNRLQADASSDESSQWIYDLAWEPKPLSQEPVRHSTRGFDEGLIANMAIGRADDELLHFAGLSVQLDPLCSAYLVRALQKMGADSLPKQALTFQELCQRLKVAPSRRRLFERLLAMLIQDGLAEQVGERFRLADFIATASERPALDAQMRKFEISHPTCQMEMDILRRCGENLDTVLLGTTDPVHVLFPNNSMEQTEHMYRDSPIARFYNGAVGDLVRNAVDQAPGRVVRILEIGAGTGATTASVLPRIAGQRVEYTFTDLSPAFLSRARSKFSNFGFVNYRALNIENDPIEQGFEPGGYDIIVAANVLHATADLRRTLRNAQKLLAPRGLLLLLEATRTFRCVDLTFGLTDGWWRFVDHDVRVDCPLVSADTWIRLMRELGMVSTRTMSYLGDGDSSVQQALVLAQAPGDAPRATITIAPHKAAQNWIVLADDFGVGKALHALLTDAGQQCQIIPRPQSQTEIAAIFDRLQGQADNGQIQVVYLWSIDVCGPKISVVGPGEGLSRDTELCAITPVHLIQALLRRKGNAAGLWMVTRGSQSTESFSPDLGGSIQSLVWGTGRTVGLEAPERFRGLIDLDPRQTPEDAAANLLVELLSGDEENQIAYRDGQRLGARLKNSRLKVPEASTSNGNRIRGDSAYLITGGLGGVGLRVATWAAAQGAGHLVLLGRTGTGASAGVFGEERLLAIQKIRQMGANVTVVEGDVASAVEMGILFDRFGAEFPKLRGVFHAATDWNAAGLLNLTDEKIETMLRPKVRGTWIIHEKTKGWDLDFFLTFSSVGSLLGTKGMAHYAAANQFLDSFAHYRRASGLPMLSVNWGTWDVMRMIAPEEKTRFAESGISTMPSEKVLNLFGDLITSRRAQVMIASIDWDVLRSRLGTNSTQSLLANFGGLDRGVDASTSASSVPHSPRLDAVLEMTPESQTKFIEAFVLKEAASVLGFRSGELPPVDVPLTDLGMDSLMAVDLKNSLQTALGQELSPTVVFDYPTVSELVGMLETMLWATHGGIGDDVNSAEKDVISI